MIQRTELLQHALLGLQLQREQIEKQMEEVRRQLDGAGAPPVEEEKPKRRLSAKGRAAIGKATKERWRRARAAGRRNLG